MIEYAAVTNGSFFVDIFDALNQLMQWYIDLPTYWIVASVVLFFLLLKIFVKHV